ncbi:MAG TPA: ArsA family ATPase [Pseudonocardia sp.]|nr:ArsA family ATPase [Pseudonocardia sp.]
MALDTQRERAAAPGTSDAALAAIAEAGRALAEAASLGDALDADLRGAPAEVDGGLFAAHVDTRALVDDAWDHLRGHLRTLLAGAGVDELVAEELTVLPGVEELLALGEVRRFAETGPWEVVVVDCGPTAETLRLLGLPEALAGYVERLFPAHRRAVRGLLAGLAGARATPGGAGTRQWDTTIDALDGLAEQLGGLHALLSDHARTSIRLVLTPERVVAAETRRTLTALALHGLRVDALVANRLVPEVSASLRGPAARWLRQRGSEQRAVLGELASLDVPLRTAPCAAAEPTGVPALLEIARALYGDDDPVAPGGAGVPALRVRRTAGSGISTESEFELVLRLPGVGGTPVDLARVGDELAVTVGGVRRLVALPAVLRRCVVLGARLDGDELVVVFRPDPELWMR